MRPATRSWICARVKFGTGLARVRDQADRAERERREHEARRVARAPARARTGRRRRSRAAASAIPVPVPPPTSEKRGGCRVLVAVEVREVGDDRRAGARAAHRDRARRAAGAAGDERPRRSPTAERAGRAARTCSAGTYRPPTLAAGPTPRLPARTARDPGCRRGASARPSAASASTASRRPLRARMRTVSTLRPPRSCATVRPSSLTSSGRCSGWRRAARSAPGDVPRLPLRVARSTRTCGGWPAS